MITLFTTKYILNSKYNMKITIVSLGVTRKEYPFLFNWLYITSPGIHYVTSALAEKGFEVSIINKVDENLTDNDVIDRLHALNPDMVLYNQFHSSREEIKKICSSLPAGAIRGIGGHDATFHSLSLSEQEFKEAYSHVDFVWQGECENGLADFIKNFRRGLAPVRINNMHNRVQDLDRLPVLKHDDYTGEIGFLATSRGCLSNGCDFCTTPGMYPDGWRARSVSHIADEIRNIKRTGRCQVYVVDDNFLGNTEKDLERGLAVIRLCKNNGLKLYPMTSVQQILRADGLGYLSEFTGTVISVLIGVENGDPVALRKLGKRVNIENYREQCIRAVDALHRHGVFPFIGYINFNPETTCDELENSARFLYEDLGEAALFTYLYNKLGIFSGTKSFDRYMKGNKCSINSADYSYDFFDRETGIVAMLLDFVLDHIRIIDFLYYEATILFYMNQLMGTPVWKKYIDLKKTLNRQNYYFFINAVGIVRKNKPFTEMIAMIGDFKTKVKQSVAEFKLLIPQIVSQSNYILREPLQYIDMVDFG